MKIYIRTSFGHGITYSVNVESSMTIRELKQRLCEKISGFNVETMDLIFNKEQLYDEDSMVDYDIWSGSILELIDSRDQARQFGGFIGLKFVDVSDDRSLKRIEWAKTAPRWRRARQGLCLEGPCKNSNCEAFKQTVIISLGFRTFDLVSDVNEYTCKCPICKQWVEPITCAFNNCWWRYEGIKSYGNLPPKSCSCDWKQADDAYNRFDENQSETISWRKLKFEVVKQNTTEMSVNPIEVAIEPEEPNDSKIWIQSSESTTPVSTTSLSSRLATAAIAVPTSTQLSSSLQNNTTDVKWFTREGQSWCPWNSKSCTNKLTISGQGIVEIMQRTSKPFELILSNKNNLHDPTAFSIILSVNQNRATLSTTTKQLDTSTEGLHILQSEQDCWHRYWISFYAKTGNIQYGIGEIRPLFSIFNVNLPENELKQMKEICYLHVKLDNNENMLTELAELKYQIRFYIGKNPLVYDHPLLVIPQNQYSLEDLVFCRCVPPSKLEKPCKDLYDTVINFQLNNDDFPDLTRVIDNSITNPEGWCYKKLVEKANRFGKPNLKATYLRLTAGQRTGNAPGHNFVIEIWPPGHFSPIHNHGNVYSIIRVLCGEVLVRLYPTLMVSIRDYQPIEQIFREGSVTWMSPSLNQIHQVKNVNLHGACCITIQCYAYGPEDEEHYEYFDYVTNDGKSIGHFDPVPDMDFFDFIKLMRKERQNIFSS